MRLRKLQWLLLWRRKPSPNCEVPRQEEGAPPETAPEEVSMPAEQRNEPNSGLNETSPQRVQEAGPKPVLVLPTGPTAVAKLEEIVADLPGGARNTYFMHGCYAAARPGRPRLTAPDLIPDTREKRLPGAASSTAQSRERAAHE
jgi:hypothetical protein